MRSLERVKVIQYRAGQSRSCDGHENFFASSKMARYDCSKGGRVVRTNMRRKAQFSVVYEEIL